MMYSLGALIIIVFICLRLKYLFICLIASLTPFTLLTEIVGDKYSVAQSLFVAVLIFLEANFFIVLSPTILHPNPINLVNIGLHLGGRDHSTVIHACKHVEKKIVNDNNFKSKIYNMINNILGK